MTFSLPTVQLRSPRRAERDAGPQLRLPTSLPALASPVKAAAASPRPVDSGDTSPTTAAAAPSPRRNLGAYTWSPPKPIKPRVKLTALEAQQQTIDYGKTLALRAATEHRFRVVLEAAEVEDRNALRLTYQRGIRGVHAEERANFGNGEADARQAIEAHEVERFDLICSVAIRQFSQRVSEQLSHEDADTRQMMLWTRANLYPHAVRGRIEAGTADFFVTRRALLRELAHADAVLLGEEERAARQAAETAARDARQELVDACVAGVERLTM